MRQFAMFFGAVVLIAAGRMMTPPPEPEHPRVEPEPAPIAAAIPPAQPAELPGQGQPQPAAPQGG